MPPEPSTWDRKDLFKEKKNERSDALGSVARWRDSHHGSRDFARWGSDDFRRPQGHGKQDGYQLFPDDSGYGCTISRSGERVADDDICRFPASRAEAKYGRNSRESKGSFSQKDWKGNISERDTDVNFSSSGRPHEISAQRLVPHEISAQRSVDDLLTYPSHPHSDIENSSWDQLNCKDHHDKMGGLDGLGTGYRYDKDHSFGPINWKPRKWTRSGSLSSRGSGFSHSGSSRCIKADSEEMKPDLRHGKVPSACIPSGDASVAVNNAAPVDESCLRKKQRLGWGQGLAKYEKAKVEGPDEIIGKGGLFSCSNNNRIMHGPVPSMSDKSPRITGLSECASPATPSSVACSSSPGVDDKSYNKVADIDNDMSNLSDSPDQGFQNFLEEFPVSLENLELNPLNNLSSLLSDLVQAEDASSGDSCFVRSTGTNKLLLLKSDILKAIEKTEYEIDLFDSELKSLNLELEIGGFCLRGPSSLQVISVPKHCTEVCDASNVLPTTAPLQVAAAGEVLEEKPMIHNDTLVDVCTGVGDEDIDSPRTSTSKFVEPPCVKNPDSSADVAKHEESSMGLEVASSTTAGGQSLLPSDKKRPAASVSGAAESNHRVEINVSGVEEANNLVKINSSAQISSNLGPHSGKECKLHSSIFASNKDNARKAFEVFNKLLPSEQHEVDIWGASCAFNLQNRVLVKKKLATRKCFLRFKERILTMKFRAIQYLWKDDMRLLSRRKSRSKFQRRFEMSSRVSHAGHQKNRSSIRSRFTSTGNSPSVYSREMMDFASKLLSDSQIKLYRNSLKMPALILDEKERKLSRFITTNGLVEDPCAVEKEKSMINPWTLKEKEIFMEMLATFGKDFKKIASFLEHKTTADCVEFYYKNQKSESFDKIKKKLDLRKLERSYPANTYLVTSGKKWNREVNAASLDMLGAASVIAAQADESLKAHQICEGKLSWVGLHGFKTCDDAALEVSTGVDILAKDKEATAADVLTGICGALSSEAMSSCVTSSVDPGEGCQEWKSQKVSYRNNQPLTPEVMQLVDDEETCSDDSCGELDSVDWTDDEKSIFIQALRAYGKDFGKISRCMGTRSQDQCKIFFSKARKCLGLDVIQPGPGNDGMPVSDTNGGRSDTEDACVVEMESAICSTQSSSRMDVDLPLDMEASTNVGITNLQTDTDGFIEKKHLGQSEDEGSEKDLGVVADDVLAVPKCGFDGDIKSMEQVEGKVETALSYEQRMGVHESLVSTAEKEHGKESTEPTVALVDEPVCAEGPKGDEVRLNCAVDLHAEPRATAGHMMCSEITHPAVSGNGLDDRKHTKSSADTNSNTSTLFCFPPDSPNSKASGSVADRRIIPGFSSTSNVQHQVSLEGLSSVHNPQIISWPPKESCPVSASLVLQDSSVVHSADHMQPPLPPPSSTLNVEEQGNKQQLESSNADIYHQYLLGQSLNQVVTSQILRGYPLHVLNKKEINGDIDSKSSGKSSVVNSFSKMNRDQHSYQHFVQESYDKKCTTSILPHSVDALYLPPRTQEQSTSDHPRPHLLSSPDVAENSRKTGDVKLFGQILSHPSPLQKPNPTSSRDGDDKGMSPDTSGRAFNLKFTPNQGTDGSSVMPKVDPCKNSSLDDFPMMSYGFWDGNRIQTGLSSLPDPAVLLAKYPVAFGDYSTSSSCRVEPQPLPPTVKRNDHNLGCVSIFPSKDVVSGDFQAYRTYDGTEVQPFMVDMKRHDVFSEMQKRNGYEGVPGFQTQGRVAGMNGVGGGSILVGGGSCTGVSDPVAAIQMHYASAERYGGGQAGSIREEESWRRGDIGR
ncbi:uncharacterized protein LOC122082443 isoform X2 [Macadamia integrifolia]|uniref:uncharacterized protein LOC122082443 isoform X2 n=1 Tax=Macadamia integrifolia TaxID=60698 RepID=UPI001C500BEA|nr:uncharacterized protein LOC122082443 isoform X2 [Macadamia integrifolia]